MGTSKSQLQQLAQERLDAADKLLDQALWSSAYYLSGYAVELALKACIAGQFRADEIPDKNFVNSIHTHHLQTLSMLAGFTQLNPKKGETPPPDLQVLLDNWATVSDWRETSRYEKKTEQEARALVGAIGDSEDGVFQWLKKHW